MKEVDNQCSALPAALLCRKCAAELGQSGMEYILNSLDKGILKIELNRPQKRNALTLDMYDGVR
jgi:1,4-dihydroxy-2-naphthoyl-CoA synthase